MNAKEKHAIYMRKWRQENRESWYKSAKKWRDGHKDLVKQQSKRRRSKMFFGGKKDIVLKRDDYKCVECGMTNEKHKTIWGRELTTDHIDGNGRNSKNKNNSIDNLQTLCLMCHGKKDGKRRLA